MASIAEIKTLVALIPHKVLKNSLVLQISNSYRDRNWTLTFEQEGGQYLYSPGEFQINWPIMGASMLTQINRGA